jgi:hypothetical protein
MPVQVPSKPTLARYGLTEDAWRKMLDEQDGKCFICEKEPKKGRLCIDHFHVKDWKKMEPTRRVMWVRGLLCWYCNNRFLSRGIDIKKSKRIVEYLERFENKMCNDKNMPSSVLDNRSKSETV